MAFDLNNVIGDIKERVTDLAQSGVAKSKQLAEVAKLKANNMSEEDAIRKAYLEIGKLYYAERGMAPEGAYVALCEKVTAAKTNIESNNARLAEMKEKEPELEIEDVDVEAEADVEVPAEPEAEAPAAPEAPEENCCCGCGEKPEEPEETEETKE